MAKLVRVRKRRGPNRYDFGKAPARIPRYFVNANRRKYEVDIDHAVIIDHVIDLVHLPAFRKWLYCYPWPKLIERMIYYVRRYGDNKLPEGWYWETGDEAEARALAEVDAALAERKVDYAEAAAF